MTNHTHLGDKLGGDDTFRAWNYRISLILEENDLDQYIGKRVIELEGDEAKARAKRIIIDYIKDHIIPHMSSLKTPKEVFDVLTKLFEGKNINRKMTLRN